MAKVKREKLLFALDAISPGLSKTDILEQSSCFVFMKNGQVATYNGEIACLHKSPLNGFVGAVQAEPLLDILKKLDHDVLSVSSADNSLVLSAKSEETGIGMEAKVLLPVDKVETPKKWKSLSEEFTEGINLVQHSAGNDDQKFNLTCVHIHPEWVEACDNIQAAKYITKTPIKQPTLVKADSIKHIVSLGMTEIAETSAWLHFKNPSGLVLSCARWTDSYVDTSGIFKITGKKAQLPKGLADAASKGAVFSKENSDYNRVSIELSKGLMKLEGRGSSGWYRKSQAIDYKGERLNFLIDPELIVKLTKDFNDCEISDTTLKVERGSLTFITALDSRAQTKKKKKKDKK